MPADPKVLRAPKQKRGLQRRRMKQRLPSGTAAWRIRRDAHFAAHPTCEFPHHLVEVPCAPPYDAQHVRARGMGGTKHDTSRLLTLCRAGHTYAETHRAWAREHGLAVHLWEAA